MFSGANPTDVFFWSMMTIFAVGFIFLSYGIFWPEVERMWYEYKWKRLQKLRRDSQFIEEARMVFESQHIVGIEKISHSCTIPIPIFILGSLNTKEPD